mmetsp:Transcript_4289/g.8324  ORF Transcript_4289/g.8324 Transcript_4289/m.8324 type:complete len:129 (-) Transcript_4289:825-1211(-)|eukprot:CAMPEP_0113312720 /NCGR_PEP_ID=MMETSP0010_2-20120614/9442_1 /TAXON_ID=216773 ORGANISM="Corethron hystrix, Strain 308" /NCGR_SAMPLE_ID=MMETSP0010_2 /ASSEMBLY_ACC=CAM_ASM_000155 /LENGTH=128 /DNA_ID=CAMNT_0000168611 /DNA_START=635 /DNA_END=1021 /DNA_ORIENTATION=+ /assembly_acc=CAM_ASM_000155
MAHAERERVYADSNECAVENERETAKKMENTLFLMVLDLQNRQQTMFCKRERPNDNGLSQLSLHRKRAEEEPKDVYDTIHQNPANVKPPGPTSICSKNSDDIDFPYIHNINEVHINHTQGHHKSMSTI